MGIARERSPPLALLPNLPLARERSTPLAPSLASVFSHLARSQNLGRSLFRSLCIRPARSFARERLCGPPLALSLVSAVGPLALRSLASGSKFSLAESFYAIFWPILRTYYVPARCGFARALRALALRSTASSPTVAASRRGKRGVKRDGGYKKHLRKFPCSPLFFCEFLVFFANSLPFNVIICFS